MSPGHTTRAALSAALLSAAVLAGCAHASVTARAQALVRQHQEDAATALLRTELAAHPDDVPARRLLVRLLGYTGDLPGARRETEQLAAILGTSDPTPYIELGHAFELSHRYDEALDAYDRVLGLRPRFAAAHLGRAWALAKLGRREESARAIDQAESLGAPATNVARLRATLAPPPLPPQGASVKSNSE
jgi:tetratricopeptide (TPR) repeat protein